MNPAAGCVALAIVLLMAQPAAGAAVQATFASPAQAEGNLVGDGLQWMLLVFQEDSETSLELALKAPARMTNHTQVWHTQNTPVSRGGTPYPLPDRSSDLSQDLTGQLAFRTHRWSSVYVEAESIVIRADQVQATLTSVVGPDWAEHHLPDRRIPPSAWYSQPLSPGQVATGLAGGADGFTFVLEATKIHRVVWHNATLHCTSSCVDAGGPVGVNLAPLSRMAVNAYSYIDLTGPDGGLRGHGRALAAAAGGPVVNLGVQGKLRLPEANLAGTCPGGPCPNPDGKTFLVSGNLTLDNLSIDPVHSNRLQTGLAGEFADAAFDETRLDVFSAPVLLGGAVGLGLLALLAKLSKSIWTGFSRRARPPALEHPRRQAIHDLIRDEPGLSFRDLQRRLGLPIGTLQKHLRRLKDDDLVMTRQHRNTVRYFENKQMHHDAWKREIPLRNDEARQLYDWLSAHPGTNQTLLAKETATWGWTLAKTRRRLALLLEGGVLAVQRIKGQVFYRTLEHHVARDTWKTAEPTAAT